MPRQETASTIINRVAVEVGLSSDSDPVGSSDQNFIQLTSLLNAAGMELLELHPWQVLRNVTTFTTDADVDTGVYDLADDFGYIIPQTMWDRTNDVPVEGPMSAQDWAELDGLSTASSTIYAKFRLVDNKLELYPQPPPDALAIRYEYISRWWVQESGESAGNTDVVDANGDTILLDPLLVIKFLKVKWLEAKGFNASAARLEFENIFLSRTGRDESAGILNCGSGGRGVPLLNAWRNVGDTGYGS